MLTDPSIADRIRGAGLRCTETMGWRTRGTGDLTPFGSVNHHTAAGGVLATPSLSAVIFGFPGSAPGPLCNVLQSRERTGDDIFYVIAAGKANHAGEGGWAGLSGNHSVLGLEIEHDGVSPLSIERQLLAARFHAAMARGRWTERTVCQHYEWAPGRKIDAATMVFGDQFRGFVRDALGGKPPPPPPVPEEIDVWTLTADLQKDEEAQLAIPHQADTISVRIVNNSNGKTDNKAGTWAVGYYTRSDQKNIALWSTMPLWVNAWQTIEQTLPAATTRAIGFRNDGNGRLAVTVSGT